MRTLAEGYLNKIKNNHKFGGDSFTLDHVVEEYSAETIIKAFDMNTSIRRFNFGTVTDPDAQEKFLAWVKSEKFKFKDLGFFDDTPPGFAKKIIEALVLKGDFSLNGLAFRNVSSEVVQDVVAVIKNMPIKQLYVENISANSMGILVQAANNIKNLENISIKEVDEKAIVELLKCRNNCFSIEVRDPEIRKKLVRKISNFNEAAIRNAGVKRNNIDLSEDGRVESKKADSEISQLFNSAGAGSGPIPLAMSAGAGAGSASSTPAMDLSSDEKPKPKHESKTVPSKAPKIEESSGAGAGALPSDRKPIMFSMAVAASSGSGSEAKSNGHKKRKDGPRGGDRVAKMARSEGLVSAADGATAAAADDSASIFSAGSEGSPESKELSLEEKHGKLKGLYHKELHARKKLEKLIKNSKTEFAQQLNVEKLPLLNQITRLEEKLEQMVGQYHDYGDDREAKLNAAQSEKDELCKALATATRKQRETEAQLKKVESERDQFERQSKSFEELYKKVLAENDQLCAVLIRYGTVFAQAGTQTAARVQALTSPDPRVRASSEAGIASHPSIQPAAAAGAGSGSGSSFSAELSPAQLLARQSAVAKVSSENGLAAASSAPAASASAQQQLRPGN